MDGPNSWYVESTILLLFMWEFLVQMLMINFQLKTSSHGVAKKGNQQPIHHGWHLENPGKALKLVELSCRPRSATLESGHFTPANIASLICARNQKKEVIRFTSIYVTFINHSGDIKWVQAPYPVLCPPPLLTSLLLLYFSYIRIT